MSEEAANGHVPFQDSRSNSSQAYLKRAASAVAEGDSVLGIHLYLAAYERALRENIMPGQEVIEGMGKAWELALATKQRSLAEYIFEKLEPYWNSDEVSNHADELQRLAFDKLEEFGFDRTAIEGMAEMVNQDMMDAAPDVLCHFEESSGVAAPSSSAHEKPQPAPAQGNESAPKEPEEAQPAAQGSREQAVKDLTSLIFGQQPDTKAEPAAPEQRFDYQSLVGFDGAIATMGELGIGRSRDPEFARFIAMLNARHGLPGIPGVGTLLFRCPAREDANYFMVATAGELNMPAIRMRLDQNAQGQAVLCVMASSDFKSRISGVPRAGFDSPTVVILEDFDLWDLPDFDPQSAENPVQGLLQMQLSRGAREALALIQTALESPEATVLISASEPNDIDPFFWELIGPQYRIIDVELPDVEERREIWREVQAQHPSTRGLDVTRMVELSRGLSRFEILAIASEAVEEAYRESVARNRFCAVSTGAMVSRLANFQPLDSDEYRCMEDLAVEELRSSTSDFDDLLED